MARKCIYCQMGASDLCRCMKQEQKRNISSEPNLDMEEALTAANKYQGEKNA